MSETTTPTTPASSSPGCPECAGPIRRTVDMVCPACGTDYRAVTMPGLELVPPGVAYQVQAAHDAVVGTLQALLAEARQDADRNAEQHVHAMDRVDALAAELGVTRGLPVRGVVTAAKSAVEGRGAPGSMARFKELERTLAALSGDLRVVVAAARWTDRYGRIGAVEALDAVVAAVRDLPAGEGDR